MLNLPERTDFCVSCNLCAMSADRPTFVKIAGSGDLECSTDPLVLVVVSGYAPDVTSLDHPGGDLLRIVLESLEGVRWAVMGTIRCPGGSNSRPTPSQHYGCTADFYGAVSRELSLSAVVLLGKEAASGVLGKSAPKSIRAAARKTYRVVEDSPPIVIGPSPWAHRPHEDEDISAEWLDIFTRAEKLAKGQDMRAKIAVEEVTKLDRALELIRQIPEQFTFDPEYRAHPNDPERRNYWFPGAELLCWSVVYKDVRGERKAFTLKPPVDRDPIVWETLFRGRVPCAHFAKGDFQTPYALCKIDVFPWIKRLPTGEIAYRDPGTYLHLTDQSKAGLGILSLAMGHLGVDNWKQRKDELIAEGNARLLDMWRTYQRWEQKRGPAWKQYREYQKLAKNVEKLKRVVANLTLPAARRLRAEKALYDFSLLPVPPEPPRPIKPMVPAGCCGYEAAIPYLYWYCGCDSYMTDVIVDEIVPLRIRQLGGCGPVVTRLLARSVELTANVERVGLPVDISRVEASQDCIREAMVAIKKNLLLAPEVVNTIASNPKYRGEVDRLGFSLDRVLAYMNPGSPGFMSTLAKNLGLDIEAHKLKFFTDSGRPSYGKRAMNHLSRGKVPWEQLTHTEKVWRNVKRLKQYKDLLTKYGMFRFTTPDGYIRTDYRVIKVDAADHSGARDAGGTETGRLAAGFFQGIQKNEIFRSSFVCPPGWIFVETDYSTLEPRVLAHIANIDAWKVWFVNKLDLYCGMANEMYNLGVDISVVTPEVQNQLRHCITDDERQLFKAMFLAQMYMQGPDSLAEFLGIPLEQAQNFSDTFHAKYPQLKALQRRLMDLMKARKPVITPFGRQVYPELPNPNDPRYSEKLAAIQRHLWNLPVQGAGSDACQWLLWEFMKHLQTLGRWGGPADNNPDHWGCLCNLVHDAGWSLVREEHFNAYVITKVAFMENISLLPFEMTVALDVGIKAGYTLSDLKSVDRNNPQIPGGLTR